MAAEPATRYHLPALATKSPLAGPGDAVALVGPDGNTQPVSDETDSGTADAEAIEDLPMVGPAAGVALVFQRQRFLVHPF